MAIYYLDASAAVKYFHREPGTAWVRRLVDLTIDDTERANLVYLANISRVEVPAAVAILARTQQISVRMRDSLYDWFLQKVESEFESLPLTPPIIRRAGELTQTLPLKAHDAVQLAVALDFDETLKRQDLSLIFISGDEQLLQAAQAEGLETDNPFNHAELDTAAP
jgi:predicted nucleic acid-binding protein